MSASVFCGSRGPRSPAQLRVSSGQTHTSDSHLASHLSQVCPHLSPSSSWQLPPISLAGEVQTSLPLLSAAQVDYLTAHSFAAVHAWPGRVVEA